MDAFVPQTGLEPVKPQFLRLDTLPIRFYVIGACVHYFFTFIVTEHTHIMNFGEYNPQKL